MCNCETCQPPEPGPSLGERIFVVGAILATFVFVWNLP